MNLRLPVIALTFLLAGNATADLMPDDRKGIRSELLIEGMEHFPDMTFAIFPVYAGDQSTWRPVESGKNIRFYHLVSPDLYALPADTAPNAAVFQDPSTPRSDVEIRQVGNVPLSEGAAMIRRVYRITGINGNHVALERQPDLRYGRDGKLIGPGPLPELRGEPGNRNSYLLAGGIGAVVLVGAVVSAIVRKRSVRPDLPDDI